MQQNVLYYASAMLWMDVQIFVRIGQLGLTFDMEWKEIAKSPSLLVLWPIPVLRLRWNLGQKLLPIVRFTMLNFALVCHTSHMCGVNNLENATWG